jgi:hypothetical protein
VNRARAGGLSGEVARYVVSLVEHPACVFATLFPVAVVRGLSAAVPGRYDADCWWVAAAGREVLRTGAAPTSNMFSFVDGSVPWTMHEWLMGPLFAWGLARMGPPFLALLALTFGTATLSIALASIVRESRSALGAWLSSALLLGCYSDRFVTARPTGISLLFPVLLLALTLRPKFGLREVATAALVMLVWTNSHGSFPFGLAILGVGALSATDRGARLSAFVLSAVVTLANPYGLRLHRFVFHYLVGDEPVLGVVHRRIAEFSPLSSPYARDWATPEVAIGLLALTALLAWGLVDRGTRARALACVPVLALGVWNVRHIELSGCCCVMLLAPVTDRVATRLGARASPPPPWLRWIVVAGGVVGLATWGVRTTQRSGDDALLGRYRPAAALALSVPDGAHLFAPFDTAALVTWLAYPRGVLTFADPRNDCFRASTLESFLDLDTASGAADLADVLSRFGVTHVLVPGRHPQAAAMERLSGWRVLARKDDWTLFAAVARRPQD